MLTACSIRRVLVEDVSADAMLEQSPKQAMMRTSVRNMLILCGNMFEFITASKATDADYVKRVFLANTGSQTRRFNVSKVGNNFCQR